MSNPEVGKITPIRSSSISRLWLRAEPLPEQYRERFASRVADAITQAANADYAAARNVFVVLSDEDGRSQGERSLCRALAALCNVAVGDDDAARTLSRRAIGASARPPSGLPVYELRYRRLARAIACATCALLGDTVRADRRADAFFRLWTCKEAFLKVTGEGLSRSTRSYEIALEPPRPAPSSRKRPSLRPHPARRALRFP